MKIDTLRLRHVEEVAERAAAEVQGLRRRQSELSDDAAHANHHLRSEEERLSHRGTPKGVERDEWVAEVLREPRAQAAAVHQELERTSALLSAAVERHSAARQLADRCREYVTNENQEAAQ
ncbi:MAG: hypothetical protein ACOY9C_12845 [Pseudomonadota bacterium]